MPSRCRQTFTALANTAFLLLLQVLTSSARAQDYPTELLTTDHALLCMSPFQFKEAIQASIANDEAWIKSLNCIIAKGRLSATVIERTEFRGSYLWKVRIRPNPGEGITMWGWRFSFMSINGEDLNDFGRAIRPAQIAPINPPPPQVVKPRAAPPPPLPRVIYPTR